MGKMGNYGKNQVKWEKQELWGIAGTNGKNWGNIGNNRKNYKYVN